MKEDEKFRKKYKSFDNVLETVYQGLFNDILDVSDKILKKTSNNNWFSQTTG